jgi:tetratricopeptide (TPR) repeat protein
LAEAADLLNSLLEHACNVSSNRMTKVKCHVARGDLFFINGNHSDRAEYAAALALLPETKDGSEEDSKWRARILQRQAAVAKRDKTPKEATEAYLMARARTQRLVSDHPADWQQQRALARIDKELGELALVQGDLLNARKWLNLSLEGHHKAPTESRNDDSQWDLAITYSLLGAVAERDGDPEAAKQAHQSSVERMTQVVAANPGDSDLQQVLAESHEQVGRHAKTRGQLEEAQRAFQKTVDLIETLVKLNPADEQLKSKLMSSCLELAELTESTNTPLAMGLYRRAAQIAHHLEEVNPTNLVPQRSLARSYVRLADLARVSGDKERAARLYLSSLKRLRLVSASSTGSERSMDLSMLAHVERQLAALDPSRGNDSPTAHLVSKRGGSASGWPWRHGDGPGHSVLPAGLDPLDSPLAVPDL